VRNRFAIALTVAAAAAAFWILPSFGQGPLQGPGQNPGQGQGQGKGRGGRGGKAKGPSLPTPHMPDGHVNLGPLPGQKGLWNGSAGTSLSNSPRQVDNPGLNLPTNLQSSDVPFLPWARAVYEHRTETLTADDPHVRCKPSGGPRLYTTPYGLEFVEVPEMQRIFVMGTGGPHTWRVIFLDGRPHPADPDPTFYGHSVGHWEGGDALVVDSVGFNERFWLSREGPPHTEQLHLIERFTRTDYNTLRYEATIDDPGAYSKPWTGGWNIPWNPNGEMYEYVCQDNNRDPRHMFGGEQ
jgi:hypothetical protein